MGAYYNILKDLKFKVGLKGVFVSDIGSYYVPDILSSINFNLNGLSGNRDSYKDDKGTYANRYIKRSASNKEFFSIMDSLYKDLLVHYYYNAHRDDYFKTPCDLGLCNGSHNIHDFKFRLFVMAMALYLQNTISSKLLSKSLTLGVIDKLKNENCEEYSVSEMRPSLYSKIEEFVVHGNPSLEKDFDEVLDKFIEDTNRYRLVDINILKGYFFKKLAKSGDLTFTDEKVSIVNKDNIANLLNAYCRQDEESDIFKISESAVMKYKINNFVRPTAEFLSREFATSGNYIKFITSLECDAFERIGALEVDNEAITGIKSSKKYHTILTQKLMDGNSYDEIASQYQQVINSLVSELNATSNSTCYNKGVVNSIANPMLAKTTRDRMESTFADFGTRYEQEKIILTEKEEVERLMTCAYYLSDTLTKAIDYLLSLSSMEKDLWTSIIFPTEDMSSFMDYKEFVIPANGDSDKLRMLIRSYFTILPDLD